MGHLAAVAWSGSASAGDPLWIASQSDSWRLERSLRDIKLQSDTIKESE
jgi:hypothetical protein